jgi:hypothetical protein
MNPSNPSLEPDALRAKSLLYIQRGFRAKVAGDFDEYQLWASLALELLGKAALAKVHPALIADPTSKESLFAACGRHISPDVRSIGAKTLFDRLTYLSKEFDARHQRFCDQMALRRNAELHSGEAPFSGMSEEIWEREYWGAIDVILRIQGLALKDWVGAENASTPTKILEAAEKALDWSVKHRVKRCADDFLDKHKNPKERSEIIARSHARGLSAAIAKSLAGYDSNATNTCPACTAMGYVGLSLWEEEVTEEENEIQGPDGEWYLDAPSERVESTLNVEEFICPECSLRLFGVKEIAAAGLNPEVKRTEIREREYEEDYGND